MGVRPSLPFDISNVRLGSRFMTEEMSFAQTDEHSERHAKSRHAIVASP